MYWPSEVALYVYHEGSKLPKWGNVHAVNLLEEVEDCRKFLRHYKHDLAAQGRRQLPGHHWKEKARAAGYNYRYDAYKFARKPFAVQDAADRALAAGHSRLLWLDADVVTFAHVTSDSIKRWCPRSYPVSYLGRLNCYSECGYIGYWLPHVGARALIDGLADEYASGRVFSLSEWHDSFVFDYVRSRLGFEGYCLPSSGRGHVFVESPLGECLDHLKGVERKRRGQSDLPKDARLRQHWRAFR